MKTRIHTACLLATCAMPAMAFAQTTESEPLAEIVVTAERRSQDIQKTPISIVVLTGEDLKERGVTDINTLAAQTPSLSYTDNGNTKYFNIRGIGISESAPNQTVGVAVHWDGTYVAREFVFGDSFFDIASVEVLRGPQGTYTGQNASGGALYVNSVRPDFDGTSGFAEATIGNLGHRQLGSGVTFQLSDTVAARISGQLERRDSAYTNLGPAGKKGQVSALSQPGNLSRFLGRAQVRFRPSEDIDLLVMHQVSDNNSDGLPNQRFDVGPPPNRTIAYDAETRLDVSYHRTTAILDYKGFDAFDVRVSGAYQETKQNLRSDDDLTTATLYPALAAGSTSIRLRDHYYTGEVNLISPDDQSVRWTAGATFLDYTQPGVIQTGGGAYIYVNARRKNEAVFGEAAMDLMDGVELRLGGRYNWDHAGFTNDGYLAIGGMDGFRAINFTPGIIDFKEPTGRAVLNWEITPDHFLYATVSKGYKPGGTTPMSLRYGSETVLNYEAGWKASFLDNRLTTSVSVFHMNYDGYQTTYTPDVNNPTSAITRNVDGTKIKGVEGQFALRQNGFTLDGNFSILDATYGDLTIVEPVGLYGNGRPTVATTANLKGRTIPYAPKFSGGLGLAYEAAMEGGSLTPSIRVSHVGAQWVTFFQAPYHQIPERTLVNARIAYQSDEGWSLAAYANNLLDDDYISNVFQTPNGVGGYTLGNPAEYGVTLNYRF
ncbi:hypothetical protein IP70_11115 [alpha proteobacterium AAP38]|nr:hypothetical protein IP70_11115 [alpha proteobacterium AAP38]